MPVLVSQTAGSLATVTPAPVGDKRGRPTPEAMRAALYSWAFNKAARAAGPPPPRLAPAIAWLEATTVPLARFGNAVPTRAALDLIATKLDGRPAAANTVSRRRAAFYGALAYAVELERLPTNPLDRVRWKAPKVAEQVDRRSVVNHDQAKALLEVVGAQGGIGPHLVGFFALMYYAVASPLARRPYDLRHAAVSTWLNADVAAPRVAELAGHSVHVLLKVYAKCIDGDDEAARRRIEVALGIARPDEGS